MAATRSKPTEQVIKLITPARTTSRGIVDPDSEAYLVIGGHYAEYGPSLRLQWGGSWSLSTLIGVDEIRYGVGDEPRVSVTDRLAIDAGQDWICENPRELVAEALRLALGRVA